MIEELVGHTDVYYLATASVDQNTSIKYICENINIELFSIKYLIN